MINLKLFLQNSKVLAKAVELVNQDRLLTILFLKKLKIYDNNNR